MLPLISIIIPCYNSGDTVIRTVNSLLNQTWKNIEVLLINDGSDDIKTIKIIKSIKSIKSINIINQSNKGLPAARNFGFQKAKGKFIIPLDADDWLEPNTIEQMYKLYKKSNERCFIYCNIILSGDLTGTISKHYNFFENLFSNQLPYCILLKKDDWLDVGKYDISFKSGYEDWEFNIRLYLNGIKPIHLKQNLFNYQVKKEGMLLSKSFKQHGYIWKDIINKNKDLYKFRNLIRLWLKWRKKASNRPLILYLFLFILYKLLPTYFLSFLVKNVKGKFQKNIYFNN